MKQFVTASVVSAFLSFGWWACSSDPASSGAPPAPSPTLNSVSVTGTTPAPGGTSQFTATASLSNGSTQNVTNQSTWQSSDSSVATVNATGLVTGIDGGEVEIRATYQNVPGTLRVTLPTPQTFTLVGVVTQTGSTSAVPGATVRVSTGLNSGRSSGTDGNGYYSIGGLRTGAFTIQGS
jgi:uncharacterized protein YjdB